MATLLSLISAATSYKLAGTYRVHLVVVPFSVALRLLRIYDPTQSNPGHPSNQSGVNLSNRRHDERVIALIPVKSTPRIPADFQRSLVQYDRRLHTA
ncbi:hypothetical protein BV25DRAFT_1831528 [Artomyces pyxidatus]|uniref:Uncharacterized protein n=1 Tax=Artomyces pyxidatus TaxID=48021 RepID=A0ACB8SKE2_9AGAM|nr:hypothetical protein BV25DRAFT_1831528 [Artomyces pyxidatus]